ncbi:YvrJ family protein [Exiguobacterium profundum]|nr:MULTISPECIES: YvrJ family protein [Exiguobacterium]QPI68272.1 YvrJ family protein [Exiguobacterium sp. PBE]MBG0917893.1 YvrJ family protein [Exiguobacterium sp. SRB7LM]MCT4797787.1 YvrJ family protein [Exiguobacterium profundum]MCV9900178.1 YvrJ family protein [Exiguobacterium sp. N5]MDT0192428.1 YvrJ family protein [Exiguobacterium sp. BG5(2022)]
MSWPELISNLGFPIVVSLYLLHRIETKLDRMIQLLERMDTSTASET